MVDEALAVARSCWTKLSLFILFFFSFFSLSLLTTLYLFKKKTLKVNNIGLGLHIGSEPNPISIIFDVAVISWLLRVSFLKCWCSVSRGYLQKVLQRSSKYSSLRVCYGKWKTYLTPPQRALFIALVWVLTLMVEHQLLTDIHSSLLLVL